MFKCIKQYISKLNGIKINYNENSVKPNASMLILKKRNWGSMLACKYANI